MTSKLRRRQPGGFTLVEMMVVVAIMAILMTLLAPAFNSVINGWRLTSTANSLIDGMRLAHDQAFARIHEVEFRLYKTTPSSGGASGYCAYSSYVLDDTGANPTPLDKFNEFSQSVVIATGTSASGVYSSLLSTSMTGTDSAGRGYVAFHFMPDGSTDLFPTSQWFATVLPQRYATSTTLPSDYVVVLLNPLNGAVTSFRP